MALTPPAAMPAGLIEQDKRVTFLCVQLPSKIELIPGTHTITVASRMASAPQDVAMTDSEDEEELCE